MVGWLKTLVLWAAGLFAILFLTSRLLSRKMVAAKEEHRVKQARQAAFAADSAHQADIHAARANDHAVAAEAALQEADAAHQRLLEAKANVAKLTARLAGRG